MKHNGRVDAAARIQSSIAGRIKLRNTLPPLASNDLLSGARHYLCVRTNRFLPEAIQTVCILPGRDRVIGQTRKFPNTSLSKLSLLPIDAGIVFRLGTAEISSGSKTPSNRLVPMGHNRMLGVPL